jgi:hypothetical protein
MGAVPVGENPDKVTKPGNPKRKVKPTEFLWRR